MTKAQRLLRELLDRQSKDRQRLAELAGVDSLSDEQREEIDRIERGIPDQERQIRAARAAIDAERNERRTRDGGENRELRELRGRVAVHRYIDASMESRAVKGAEAEFNAALGMKGGSFPMRLLAPEPVEARATTDVDAEADQVRWLDRLFADTAAMRVGVTFEAAEPGAKAYPVTTGGASAAQRGREEAAADGAWTVGVSELKPTRNAVRAVFTIEDAARLPGLEDALVRDLRMALTEGVDRAIFLGDAGADEDSADIVGLTTAADVVEKELTQANKAKAANTVAVYADLVDGIHAASFDDLRIVTSVGTNSLWMQTIFNNAADNMTIAQFLRASGLSWAVRGEIDTETEADDWGAFVGRARGMTGAAVSAIWDEGMLIRDPYTNAKTGEVAITISHLWAFGLPRASNFARVKYVA